MFLRPSRSDYDDQPIRPSMLASDSSATNPAAAEASTALLGAVGKKSWEIGDAFSRMPIPAVTLKHSTTQSSQNWGVLMALAADTLAVVINDPVFCGSGFQPCGVQPGAGTRISSHPIDMNTAYVQPITRKVLEMPAVVLWPNASSRLFVHGEAISAPPPKPMIARPVA